MGVYVLSETRHDCGPKFSLVFFAVLKLLFHEARKYGCMFRWLLHKSCKLLLLHIETGRKLDEITEKFSKDNSFPGQSGYGMAVRRMLARRVTNFFVKAMFLESIQQLLKITLDMKGKPLELKEAFCFMSKADVTDH